MTGYELCPGVDENELYTRVLIETGDKQHEVKNKDSNKLNKMHFKKGRFPEYNFTKSAHITLESKLEFAQDMRIILIRRISSDLKPEIG